MATKKKAAPPVKSILHEKNSKGQHRIIVLTAGKPDHSAWFEGHEVAKFKGFHANLSGSTLPYGVFRVTGVTYEPLDPERFELPRHPVERSDPL